MGEQQIDTVNRSISYFYHIFFRAINWFCVNRQQLPVLLPAICAAKYYHRILLRGEAKIVCISLRFEGALGALPPLASIRLRHGFFSEIRFPKSERTCLMRRPRTARGGERPPRKGRRHRTDGGQRCAARSAPAFAGATRTYQSLMLRPARPDDAAHSSSHCSCPASA
jgi:hypothetical protein